LGLRATEISGRGRGMRPLKAVVLDFWGTLFKPVITLDLYVERRVKALWYEIRVRGHEVDVERVREAYLSNRAEVDAARKSRGREVRREEEAKGLLRKFGLKDQMLVRPLVRGYLRPFLDSLRPVRGAKEVLELLRRRGYLIALLSNTFYGHANRALLVKYGLMGYFHTLKFSDETGWRKPRREAFEEVLSDLGVEADEALMVGDSLEEDIKGAEGVGMRAVKVAGIGRQGPELKEALLKEGVVR